jgi:hypothetical protein
VTATTKRVFVDARITLYCQIIHRRDKSGIVKAESANGAKGLTRKPTARFELEITDGYSRWREFRELTPSRSADPAAHGFDRRERREEARLFCVL